LEKLTFVAKLQKNRRIYIPKNIIDILQLHQGDYVEVKIRKIIQGEEDELNKGD
jgi:bifunctional DNA-binding transcriptional regulator/antitoxin component of YhaV-PrlF toxin-antitoxin module